MAQVKVVDKKIRMSSEEIIRFQLATHCYIENIILSDLDLDCLVALGKLGKAELTPFCQDMADKRLEAKLKTWKEGKRRPEASPQTIRNVILRMEKDSLILKEGTGRKSISLNPNINIQTEGNILLNYKAFYIGTQESQNSNTGNS